MMHKLMYWLTGFLKCRTIDIDGEPYLERYYLATIFGKRIFIHRFMDSDPDRGLHDHPWRWARSFILAGGYNELVLKQDMVCTVKRRAPAYNFINGGKFHRVVMPEEFRGRTWTLFVHGPRDRDWGFLEYTYDTIHHEILDSNYIKANTDNERKQNMSWWKRADAKTGNEVRRNR